MVVKEYYSTRDDGVKLYRSYSSDGFMLHKVGTDEIYDEAIDVEGAPFAYDETTEFIEHEEG